MIPASRMKNLGRDQHVPLVGRALAIARELTAGRDPEAPVFGNHRPINPNAIRKSVLPKLLKAIGHEARATTHGFRSCLKDWCHVSGLEKNEAERRETFGCSAEHP